MRDHHARVPETVDELRAWDEEHRDPREPPSKPWTPAARRFAFDLVTKAWSNLAGYRRGRIESW